jgi:hypothetical protein
MLYGFSGIKIAFYVLKGDEFISHAKGLKRHVQGTLNASEHLKALTLQNDL